jgi:transposase
MRAYSLALRLRMVEAVDRQVGSQGAGALLLGVSRTLVKKRLRQRRETGSVAPKPQGGGHRPKLAGKRREVVRTYLLEDKNDASLAAGPPSVERGLKVVVRQATVSRVLQSLGLPRKKNAGSQRAG